MKGVKRARYDEEDSNVKANTLDGRPKVVMDLAQKVKIVSYDNIFSPFELRVHLWLSINVSRNSQINSFILCVGSEGEDLGLHWLSCTHLEALLQQR
jgi:hypothetical protein